MFPLPITPRARGTGSKVVAGAVARGSGKSAAVKPGRTDAPRPVSVRAAA